MKYGRQDVALGSMVYKHASHDSDTARKLLSLPEINLKIIPGPDGEIQVAQLLSSTMENISVSGTWRGPARLSLSPHVVCEYPHFY